MNVKVRDMEIEKIYIVNGEPAILTDKIEAGAGGSGHQEPYYKLIFEDPKTNNKTTFLKDWDETFTQVTPVIQAGKRKSKKHNRKSNKSKKHNRKSNKSRRNRRKSNRRR